MGYHIEAVTVNHNTSSYMELMLRSLFARHSPDLNLSITVVDNASEDDMTGLRAYAERIGIPIVQSGFSMRSQHNSHGEILSRFVLEHPDCTHYLFLDADICFIEDNTLVVMRHNVDFAIVPCCVFPLDGLKRSKRECLDYLMSLASDIRTAELRIAGDNVILWRKHGEGVKEWST